MPELAACQSAPAQAARLAWARRPSSSDASAMAQSTGSSGAGSGSMSLEKSSSWGVERRGLCNGSFELVVVVCP